MWSRMAVVVAVFAVVPLARASGLTEDDERFPSSGKWIKGKVVSIKPHPLFPNILVYGIDTDGNGVPDKQIHNEEGDDGASPPDEGDDPNNMDQLDDEEEYELEDAYDPKGKGPTLIIITDDDGDVVGIKPVREEKKPAAKKP